MSRKILTFTVLALTLLACSIATSISSKSVCGPYYTWDADMLDVDELHLQGYTGEGVYVAVLDTGLAPNWKDYFPADRIAEKLGKGFVEPVHFDPQTGEYVYSGVVHETTFIGSQSAEHGTHVTSTIIGYNYYAIQDAVERTPLPPIYVEGIAPDVTIIPVKVLADYHFGPKNLPPGDENWMNFGTENMVAAGINYATDLAIAGYSPMIVTMSLGGGSLAPVEKAAIDRAITNGVIVVAAAGNAGADGMDYPGAYAPVISVGACGWEYEWYWGNGVAPPPRNRIWWLQSPFYAYNDIPEPTPADDVYICDFSSRELAGQDLDVVAPGSWVRGPYAGNPGYSHLPWWSHGYPAAFYSRNPGNFYYVGGTSMSTPHVTGIVAMMLQKNPSLVQAQVEIILENTALAIPPGSMTVWDLSPTQGWYTYSWGADATGKGLIQAKAAVAAA